MKLDINTKVFSDQLQKVAGIKGKTIPILSHVLLEAAKDGTFSVSASDLEVGKRVVVGEGVEVAVPGGVAVRADQLRDIVKVIPGEDVRLELLDGLRLEIVSGDFVSRVSGLDRSEFPQIDGKEKKMKSLSLHADDLKGFIGSCAHSMCADSTKYYLCGIFLQCDGQKEGEQGNLVAVSTDGHRLSLAARNFDDVPPLGVIVPRKGVEELLKLDSDHVGLHVGKRSLEVVQGGTFMSIRLMEGEYPYYRNAIPSGYTDYCTVDRSSLIDAVARVRLFSSRNSIVLGIGSGSISLRASKENDEGSDVVLCRTVGQPVTIKLDARYFLEALTSLGGDEVVLKYGGELSPMVMLPADFEKWDERLTVLGAQRL